MKRIILYQIDAFTKEKFKGNPAGVVLNSDGLNDTQLQLIARELNNSETAFLFKSDSSDCDGIIRYFTPKTEVPTCGHATIAAMFALANEKKLESCILRYKTRIGILPFEIIKTTDAYQVTMTQGKFELSQTINEKIKKELLLALGISNLDLDSKCPIQIASTGHSKVMIGVNNREILNEMTPDFLRLSDLSQQIKCNGYFVFTFDSGDKDILTCGRMFAPAIGINEDPVTGNANGPLGGYLIQNGIIKSPDNYFEFNGIQGEKLYRPGKINVRVTSKNRIPISIQIKGEAVTIFKTEIIL